MVNFWPHKRHVERMMTLHEIRARALSALAPPPRLHLSTWIEREIVLPEGTSALPGRVRLWPYHREIADAISDIEPIFAASPALRGTSPPWSRPAAAEAAVEREWSDVLRQVRAGMLAVPSRVAARLPHLTPQDIREIDQGCAMLFVN